MKNLISSAELHERLDQPDLCIVDCQSELADPRAGRRAYREGHIPGSAFADLNEDLAGPVEPDTGRHPLPDTDSLTATLRRLGINGSSEVVVYDAGPGAYAARMWWLLRWMGHERVRLLDGGLNKWKSEQRPLSGGDERVAAGDFLPGPGKARIVTTAELAGDISAIKRMNLIDARDAARFRGESEPIDAVAGHVPGAINLPFPRSLREDGTWKSRADLESIWSEVLGKDKVVEWAAMCGSGVTACHLAISAMEAGFAEPRLYVGSWSEWIRDPSRPVGLGGGESDRRTDADSA